LRRGHKQFIVWLVSFLHKKMGWSVAKVRKLTFFSKNRSKSTIFM